MGGKYGDSVPGRPGAAIMPETRYAKSDGASITCQVVRSGPLDLLVVPGWVSDVDGAGGHFGMTRQISPSSLAVYKLPSEPCTSVRVRVDGNSRVASFVAIPAESS